MRPERSKAVRGQRQGGDGCISAAVTERQQEVGKRRLQKQGSKRRKGERESNILTSIKINPVEFKLDFHQYALSPLDLVNNI